MSKANNSNVNYNNIEKKNKNFMYQNFQRSKWFNSNFPNSNFDYVSFRGAHLKSCSFFDCSFKWTEFIGSNLKGSSFKRAEFEDTIFEGAKLDGTDFLDATFENTIFLACNIENAKNLDLANPGIRVFDQMPEIEMSVELKRAVEDFMKNIYVEKSRTLNTKDKKLNTLSMMILMELFYDETLIKAFEKMPEYIDRDFHTLSYIVKLIRKLIKEGHIE